MKYCYYIILICCLFLGSCGDQNQNTDTKKTQSTTAKVDKSAGEARWAEIQASIGADDAAVLKVKKVERKFKKIRVQLKKEKQWAGPANRPNRAKYQSDYKKAVNRALGRKIAKKYFDLNKK